MKRKRILTILLMAALLFISCARTVPGKDPGAETAENPLASGVTGDAGTETEADPEPADTEKDPDEAGTGKTPEDAGADALANISKRVSIITPSSYQEVYKKISERNYGLRYGTKASSNPAGTSAGVSPDTGTGQSRR